MQFTVLVVEQTNPGSELTIHLDISAPATTFGMTV
jgi:hypothetical protein